MASRKSARPQKVDPVVLAPKAAKAGLDLLALCKELVSAEDLSPDSRIGLLALHLAQDGMLCDTEIQKNVGIDTYYPFLVLEQRGLIARDKMAGAWVLKKKEAA